MLLCSNESESHRTALTKSSNTQYHTHTQRTSPLLDNWCFWRRSELKISKDENSTITEKSTDPSSVPVEFQNYRLVMYFPYRLQYPPILSPGDRNFAWECTLSLHIKQPIGRSGAVLVFTLWNVAVFSGSATQGLQPESNNLSYVMLQIHQPVWRKDM